MDHWRNQRGNQKYTEKNDSENTKIQNLGDAAKTVLRGKFTAMEPYLSKLEKSQINNLNLHLKQPEKEEETKHKVSRMIKIRAEINEIEMKKRIAKINEIKC